LHAKYIIPSVFNRQVVKAVAVAVARAAEGKRRRASPRCQRGGGLSSLLLGCLCQQVAVADPVVVEISV
jgi:hypothetical protein